MYEVLEQMLIVAFACVWSNERAGAYLRPTELVFV